MERRVPFQYRQPTPFDNPHLQAAGNQLVFTATHREPLENGFLFEVSCSGNFYCLKDTVHSQGWEGVGFLIEEKMERYGACIFPNKDQQRGRVDPLNMQKNLEPGQAGVFDRHSIGLYRISVGIKGRGKRRTSVVKKGQRFYLPKFLFVDIEPV